MTYETKVVFTRALQQLVSSAKSINQSIQFSVLIPISLIYILKLSSELRLGLHKDIYFLLISLFKLSKYSYHLTFWLHALPILIY